MKDRVETEISVLSWSPDRSSGEALNIGVVARDCAKGTCQVWFIESMSRLSDAFAGADAKHLATYCRHFREAVEVFSSKLPFDSGSKSNLDVLLREVVPDNGLAFYYNAPFKLEFPSLEAGLRWARKRYVNWSTEADDDSRSDQDVWRVFHQRLSVSIKSKLVPASLDLTSGHQEFDYTFKNGKTHIVLPASFDLKTVDGAQNKARRIVGRVVELQSSDEFGNLFLIAGMPSNRKRVVEAAESVLATAKNLPIRVIYEDEAENFEKQLSLLEAH